MRRDSNLKGYTLVEVLATGAVVAIFAAVAVSQLRSRDMGPEVGQVAAEMKTFELAFLAYYSANSNWPPDSHRSVPSGMENLIDEAHWSKETALGGHYYYEGPAGEILPGISILEPTSETEFLVQLDRVLDDGDLSKGRFRTDANGRPTLSLVPNP